MTRLMWISPNFSTMGSKLQNPLDRTRCYHVLSKCTSPFVQNRSVRRVRIEHLTRVRLHYKSPRYYNRCQNYVRIVINRRGFWHENDFLGRFVSWFCIGFKHQDIWWKFDGFWSVHWYRTDMVWNQTTRPTNPHFWREMLKKLVCRLSPPNSKSNLVQ